VVAGALVSVRNADDALSVRNAENETMCCRSKRNDVLSVRNLANDKTDSIEGGKRAAV
jgi:hypothetical protein